MQLKEALESVKRYSRNISPYTYNSEDGGCMVNSKEEFLLGLATLIIYLIEKEDAE